MAFLFLAPLAVQTATAAQVNKSLALPTDLGIAADDAMTDIVITLKLPNKADLEAYVASTVDPGSANYRKFLTTEQFKARFGQPDAAVKRVTKLLAAQGVEVTQVHADNLMISARASNGTLAKLLGTSIHNYKQGAETFQRNVSAVQIPSSVADVVSGVVGLSTKAIYHTQMRRVDAAGVPKALKKSEAARPSATKPTSGIPEQYDTTDFANIYNVKPLYARGINGTGTTLGIMTFASFKTTDAGAYWATVGGTSDTSRITTVNASGNGKISSSGADETTLDVEQSGGIALGAKIYVYEAPNTSAGELQLYSKAITDNIADTLSISWGSPEVAEDPSSIDSLETLFLESAAHGVPVTAASGDEGAYDLNYYLEYPFPNYSTTLSVDYPASDPYVVAAGGTTLPVTLALSHGTVTVPAVRPWGWDYLYDYIVAADGQAYYYADLFPVGGGGGVSVQFPLPSYQQGVAGTQVTQPGQSLICFTSPTKKSGAITCTSGSDLIDMPALYSGRNTPDVALDADPETGYSLYYSGAWSIGSGGTSFVAPQLNGVFALLTQQKGGRLGWLHPQLYSAFKAKGYGTGSPFTPVSAGDNDFWPATKSYNPGSGLGQLDVDLLSQTLAP